jgi:hypothetical protein
VDSMDEVLALALERPLPTPVLDETEVMAAVPPPPATEVGTGQVARQ